MGKALVFGDDTRGFLATVRSLSRQGIVADASPYDFRAPALTSRHIRSVHRLPFYLGDARSWVAAIRHVLDCERYDLIVSCDERSLLPLNLHRDQFEPEHRLAIPSSSAVETFFDKHATRTLAEAVGVPVCPGRLLAERDKPEDAIAAFGLPIVLKPRRSYSIGQLHARARVAISYDRESLARAFSQAAPDRWLIETYFEGRGVGVSVLAKGGRLLQVFQHHRVHETRMAGASSYRVSAPVDSRFEQACARMVAMLRFTGIAMFEFRCNDENGDWVLLEVNARPWGSLPLAVAAGVDFPYLWYRLLVNDVEEPRAAYRTGLYGRNLTGDYNYVAESLDRFRRHPVKAVRFVISHSIGHVRALIGRESSDSFVMDDPRPGVSEFVRLIGSRVDKLVLPGTVRFRRRRAEALIIQAARTREPELAKLMFICQGNICRSPFAEALFAAERPGSLLGVRLSSAGTLPAVGRPAPAQAIQVARQFGISLDHHRSRHLDVAEAETATLIIVFDHLNAQAIYRLLPGLRTPVIALGDLLEEPAGIADPNGKDHATFEACYALISRGVQRLITSMNFQS